MTIVFAGKDANVQYIGLQLLGLGWTPFRIELMQSPRSPSARDRGHPDCAIVKESQYRGPSPVRLRLRVRMTPTKA